MNLDDLLEDLSEEDDLSTEIEDDSQMDDSEATNTATASGVMKELINNNSTFKGRITKPVVVNFKYKELSSALSEASGLTINRVKAKAMFDAFRKIMGL